MSQVTSARSGRVLIVDDEFSVRDSLCHWLRKDGYQVTATGSGAEALQALSGQRFDLALVDLKMPGMGGLELQEQIRRHDSRCIVVVITAFASVDTAVRALKQGAFDYLTKPVDPDQLSRLIARALEQQHLREENLHLRETIDELVGMERIVGENPAMLKIMELVEHVSGTDATVLIRGESGTGKELVARAIHAGSKRRYYPLVPVNCGALPESLLESELFGHEKGAFTGAEYLRRGKIELAHGGTLFLDEVGAVPRKMQVDLLRVLETKQLSRLGGMESLRSDFRVICATNDNLEEAVRTGRFREDFYYRINVFTLALPPLRERRDDIPALAHYFLERFARQMDKRIVDFAPGAMELLCEHDWPGNVRELSNAVERAMVVGRPPRIEASDLPLRPGGALPLPAGDSLADVERRHIAAVLERTGGNVTRAAEILEIDRVTVYNKIRKYGLRP